MGFIPGCPHFRFEWIFLRIFIIYLWQMYILTKWLSHANKFYANYYLFCRSHYLQTNFCSFVTCTKRLFQQIFRILSFILVTCMARDIFFIVLSLSTSLIVPCWNQHKLSDYQCMSA